MNKMVETNALIISILLLIISTLALIIFKKRTTKSNLPPSPLSLPILGHLHLLKQQQPLHETLLHLSHKYGPVMLLRFGIRPAVVVTSPSAVEECFTKTNDIVFANRPLTPLSAKHFNYNYTSMGAAPYGDLWRALRRVAASELLSTTRLDATTHLREHEVQLMCRQLINQSSQVNLKCWFRDLLNNITTMAIMGKRYHGDQVNVGDRKQALEFQGMMEELFKLLHTQNIGDFVPVLGWLGVGGVEKRMIGLMKKVDKFLEEVIEERLVKGSCESGIMVDKLLVLQKKEPDLYTDEIIKGLILVRLNLFQGFVFTI
ncbi:putative isoflavone 2'-hydroxylase [Helianthus annuus]|nr:putative isoflavone 2'-hydroxylase [Helianthus annuus]